MKKVLVSHGFGAGWSSWSPEYAKFLAEYRPIIEFIEGGGDPHDLETPWAMRRASLEEKHPLIQQLHRDIAETFDVPLEEVHVYDGGAGGLVVETVPEGDGYRIEEYDGSESLRLQSEEVWW